MIAGLFRALSGTEVAVLAFIPLGVLLPRAVRFSLLLVPRTWKRRLAAVYAYCASQAVSLMPAGIAGRAAVLKSAGLPLRRNVLPIMADSFFDHCFFALSVLLIALLVPRYRALSYLAVPIGVACVVLLLTPPLRLRFKRWTFSLARQRDQMELWKSMRRSFMRMWQPRRLAACAVLTAMANLASVFALWWIIRAFDLEVPPSALLMALLVPNLLGRIVLLPGGTGVVETGMVTMLVRSGGLDANEAAAVTVLFRLTDMLLPALYGLVLYLVMPQRLASAPPARPPSSAPTMKPPRPPAIMPMAPPSPPAMW
jgi:uncharacterized protein (TIRG00374 family)